MIRNLQTKVYLARGRQVLYENVISICLFKLQICNRRRNLRNTAWEESSKWRASQENDHLQTSRTQMGCKTRTAEVPLATHVGYIHSEWCVARSSAHQLNFSKSFIWSWQSSSMEAWISWAYRITWTMVQIKCIRYWELTTDWRHANLQNFHILKLHWKTFCGFCPYFAYST